MRQLLGSVFFLAVATYSVADEKTDASKKLNGSYHVISVSIDGQPDTEKMDKTTLTFKDGTIEVRDSGDKEKDENAKFTIDPSKKPAEIDVTPDKGDDGTLLGIFEMKETDKGTELTIALGMPKGERPKDFEGKGKGEMLVKLLRNKDK
jgi:uncharacterized protein (TIGR03067 family)